MTLMQKVFWTIFFFGNATSIALWQYHPDDFTFFLVCFIGLYSILGLHDLFFSKRNLNRLYPVVAYFRYFLESFRVEIQQYFIANDTEERPFNREERSLVYQRAKNVRDTIAFGTQHDLLEENYLSLWHSLKPTEVKDETKRITFGGPDCTQPYSASRLNISAMSFGALSHTAIEALNLGAKKGNFSHNTGEGGLSPYHLKHGGDIVWQIGSGLFGCRTLDGRFDEETFKEKSQLPQVKMIEVKLSQGAKPGHGGVLPKAKITEEIARIRLIDQGQDCVSPAMHPECQTPKQLLHFVAKLRALSGGKPVGFKLCIGNPAEFLSICKAMLEEKIYPDFITVDGSEGGTGAAPVEFANYLGMTCLEGVYVVHNALVGTGLREHIKVIASGKTASAFDLLTKLALGADTVNAARTMMFALGCIQSKHCNTNRCPTGIATQDPARAKAIDVENKSERVKNFHKNTLHTFYELLGSIGLDDPDKLLPQMVKRRTPHGLQMSIGSLVKPLSTDELLMSSEINHWTNWWHKASSDSFSVYDDSFLK
ncbi:FMN-binding glutamate synthase family protein [Pseudoalteromonas xiamenensis]